MCAMRRKGFTLIELLVVIAIIAILAGILFPVFARAKEQARLARCQSHIKQAGQAVLMYTSDWSEAFPTCYIPGYGLAGQWLGGNTSRVRSDFPPKSLRPMYNYAGKSAFMWQCPSEPKQKNVEGETKEYKDFDYWGNSYPMNAQFGPGPWGGVLYTLSANENNPNTLGRRISTVTRPTRVVLLGERGIHQYYYAGQLSPVGVFRNHDKTACRVPVCFVDGHVGYILMTGEHTINWNGKDIHTYGLFDKGWALAESGWYPGHPEWGMPLGF